VRAVLDEIDWLHDADCLSITVDTKDDGLRTLRLDVDVNPDTGNPALDGKRLQFVARGVGALELRTYKIQGRQTIDFFKRRAEPSESFRRDRRLAKTLADMPEYVICFHSGEHLGFICAELLVDERAS
jgi:hypothetical protein